MAASDEEPGLAAAVKRLSEDLGVLLKSELQLAREELTEKAKVAGAGAGMLSASAITALLMLGSLTALAIIAIALAVPLWLSALIVTIFWGAVSAVLALSGKKKIQDAGPLVPERTIESVKEDVNWAKDAVKSGRK